MAKPKTAAKRTTTKKAAPRKKTPTVAKAHPHLQAARLIEARSPRLLEDLHQVLRRHGLENLNIRSMTLSSDSSEPAAPSGLCPVWRCHTDPNGNNVCGWVLEPCNS